MSDNIKIDPEEFEKALQQILKEYGDSATDAMKEILPGVAKEGVKKIKDLSPSGDRKSNKYKDTWTHTQEAGRLFAVEHIHQKAGKKFSNWRLVHLLVKGHMSRSGKFVPPSKEHFEPTQEYVENEFMKRLKQELGE